MDKSQTNFKPIILIVDDTPMNLRVLSDMLQEEYDIRIANRGKKALEIAASKHERPDLILLDIMMPELDGYEVCRQLKSSSETSSIPVIFITAKTELEDEMKGFNLGAVDYITKPFQLPVVKARVETHIKLRQQSKLLEEFAFIDPLTQIANRRQFDLRFDEELRRAIRNGSSLALCMIDIDYFKYYNDTLGHGQGDICLKKVAQTIDSCVNRAGELSARYGGEEFVVLLPNSNSEEMLQNAEKIRSQVEALQLSHPSSEVSEYVTVSIGCTIQTMTHTNDNSSNLLELADKALYRAKNSGRNRVSL